MDRKRYIRWPHDTTPRIEAKSLFQKGVLYTHIFHCTLLLNCALERYARYSHKHIVAMPKKTFDKKGKHSEPKTLKEILSAPETDFSLSLPSGRIPPQDIEAEQSLLGSLLLDNNAIIRVVDFLRTDDFYRKQHQVIYQAMLELFTHHEPIDLLSVTAKLKENGVIDDIGGRAYLSSLINMVPTSSHALHYGKIVQKKRLLRDLIDASWHISQLGYDTARNVEEVLDEAERKIFSISEHALTQEFKNLPAELKQAFERIEMLSRHEGGIRGVPTGFTDLDNMLSGLQPSDLIIIAARPSLGKTSLALSIARHVGVNEHKPVGIFSLEMSKEQVVDRLIAAQAGVDLWRMRTGRLSSDDFDSIRDGLNQLSDAPIFIDDAATATVLQMRAMARRLQAQHGLDLIIVDYLQLISSHINSDNMVQQVTEISRSLKALARELNVPVIAISQLSRAVESRPDQKPKLSDLRESGSIEQDADVVMFIWREDMVKKDLGVRNIATIHIAKHRNGPVGELTLRFDPERATFWSLEQHRDV